MKKAILILLVLAGFTTVSHAQSIDTVRTSNYGNKPSAYAANKLYWEKNYNDKNQLVFEALKYNDCFVGAYTDYWDNGTIRTKGQYMQRPTRYVAGTKSTGPCSIMLGDWKTYDQSGKLLHIITYAMGKIIKEQ